MTVSRSILGMNARNFIYVKQYNPVWARQIVDDKIKTKLFLAEKNIATTSVIAEFSDRHAVERFDWRFPDGGFVVKPARGYGGEGILAFRHWKNDEGEMLSGKTITRVELETHLLDILDGAYSLQHLPDRAYIEELVVPNTFFRSLSKIGLPDIRVIVLNKIPVMAMMRLPTAESNWKANLHQGAAGVGIGLGTGICFNALVGKSTIDHIPGTNMPVLDIRIPEWDKILLMASEAQDASGLGFAGVDIVVDKKRGPLVLEVNARPGLSIQLVNKSSLRTRLERIENVEVKDSSHGVDLAKSLFTEPSLAHLNVTPQILSVIEPVLFRTNTAEKTIDAKIDTGAFRTSIDSMLVNTLGLVPTTEKIFIKSASGQHHRNAVEITFVLKGKEITTIATTAERSHMQYQMIVGRRDLAGFLVDPSSVPRSTHSNK